MKFNEQKLAITCGLTHKSIFFIREIIKSGIDINYIFIQTNRFRLHRQIKLLKKDFNLIKFFKFIDQIIFIYFFKLHQTPIEYLYSRIRWFINKRRIDKMDLFKADYLFFDGDLYFRYKITKKIIKLLNSKAELILISNINSKKKNIFLKKNFDILGIMGGCILKSFVLEHANKISLVLHNTYLPKLRGWGGGEIWSLIKNDKKALGFSIIKADKQVDKGRIISQENLIIKKNDNLNLIIKKNLELGVQLFRKSLNKIYSNDFNFVEQDETYASYINKKPDKNEIREGLNNLEKWKKNEDILR